MSILDSALGLKHQAPFQVSYSRENPNPQSPIPNLNVTRTKDY
ncbi:MAG: hypothetical protein ACFKPT_08185 [Gloeotrichia echinulata GP01]